MLISTLSGPGVVSVEFTPFALRVVNPHSRPDRPEINVIHWRGGCHYQAPGGCNACQVSMTHATNWLTSSGV